MPSCCGGGSFDVVFGGTVAAERGPGLTARRATSPGVDNRHGYNLTALLDYRENTGETWGMRRV